MEGRKGAKGKGCKGERKEVKLKENWATRAPIYIMKYD